MGLLLLLLLMLLRRHVADGIGLVQIWVLLWRGGDLDHVVMGAMLMLLKLMVRVLQEGVLLGVLRQGVLMETMLDVDV